MAVAIMGGLVVSTALPQLARQAMEAPRFADKPIAVAPPARIRILPGC
jgi:hypothetical protein